MKYQTLLQFGVCLTILFLTTGCGGGMKPTPTPTFTPKQSFGQSSFPSGQNASRTKCGYPMGIRCSPPASSDAIRPALEYVGKYYPEHAPRQTPTWTTKKDGYPDAEIESGDWTIVVQYFRVTIANRASGFRWQGEVRFTIDEGGCYCNPQAVETSVTIPIVGTWKSDPLILEFAESGEVLVTDNSGQSGLGGACGVYAITADKLSVQFDKCVTREPSTGKILEKVGWETYFTTISNYHETLIIEKMDNDQLVLRATETRFWIGFTTIRSGRLAGIYTRTK